MPHVGLPAKTAGPWRARGRGLPDAGQGRGSPGGCAGEVREDVQGRTSGRMPARCLLGGGPGPGGRPPGRGGPEPGEGCASTPDGRSEGSSSGCGAAGGGVVAARHLKESMPAGRTRWRRCGEIRRRAPPRTRPSGPGGHERDGPSTAISPRPGPAPCAAGPRPRTGPGLRGSIKIRRAGGRKRPQAGPAHPQAGCWTPTPRPTPRRTN